MHVSFYIPYINKQFKTTAIILQTLFPLSHSPELEDITALIRS